MNLKEHNLNETNKKAFEKNIRLNYIIGSLMWGRFFIPVLALFYIASQVSIEQFSIIMAVFAFTTLVLEIPTGTIADLLGKKRTLLLSRFMYIIEIAIIAFFNGFWPFLIAKIISGIGVSLSSGTGSALLFDTLKRLKRTDEHKKISGKLNYITNISMAFVFIIGSYLFTISPKLPAYVSLPFIILGFILTFFLKEPYIPSKKLTMKNSWIHLKQGIENFIHHKYLVYLAAFTLVIGSVISIMLSLSSAYFAEIFIPVAYIGVISFCASLLTAYTSKKAHQIEEKLGEKKSLLLIQLIIFISVLLCSFVIPYVGLIFYLLIPFVSGFYSVITGDYVNRHVKTSHRATMLSINNMFDNVGIAFIFPILGFGIKYYSMSLTFLIFSICILIYLLVMYLFGRKLNSEKIK